MYLAKTTAKVAYGITNATDNKDPPVKDNSRRYKGLDVKKNDFI